MTSTASDSPWNDQVREKLIEIYGGKNPEALMRVLFYLDEEDKTYKETQQVPPAWRTLKLTLNYNKVFKTYADRLIDATKKAETDPTFRKIMTLIYSRMMDTSEDPLPDSTHKCFDLIRLAEVEASRVSGFKGFARAWSLIPETSKGQILDVIKRCVVNRQVVTVLDYVVGTVNRVGSKVVMYGLVAISLTCDTVQNLRWWRGEISGRRCAKNIVDSTFTVGAGLAGGVAGAVVGAEGAVSGPIGFIVGGVIGGIISSQAMNFLIDRLTQFLLGIPQDEALENAYNFFGVKMTASNNEINTAFRKLCLKHHPDKGGRTDDFLLVQINMGVIKMARGDLVY